MTKTLKDWAPAEFMQGEYHDTLAYRMKDAPVLSEHESYIKRWPYRRNGKYVHVWCVVEFNAKLYAVGFNENPHRGWNFPVFRHRKGRLIQGSRGYV